MFLLLDVSHVPVHYIIENNYSLALNFFPIQVSFNFYTG